jgi:hypothetical protein
MTAQAAPADARQPGTYHWLKRYPKGVDWHQKLTPAPLYQLLDDAVAKFWIAALHQLPRQGSDLS